MDDKMIDAWLAVCNTHPRVEYLTMAEAWRLSWQAATSAADAKYAGLVEALQAIKRHQEINVKSNTDALMGTTWHIASKALAAYLGGVE